VAGGIDVPDSGNAGDPVAYGLEQPDTMLFVRSRNGIGIAAGLCGLVALLLSWIPFVDYTSLALGAIGIILGGVGVHRANVDPGKGKLMSSVGIVCGIAGFAIAAIVLLLIYVLVLTINASTL
jgi:hypothetical protein